MTDHPMQPTPEQSREWREQAPRPKPPTLAEQALAILATTTGSSNDD